MASHKFLKKVYEKNFRAKRSRAGRIVKHQHMNVVYTNKNYSGEKSPYWDYMQTRGMAFSDEPKESAQANPDMLPEVQESNKYPQMVLNAQGHLRGQQRKVFDLVVVDGLSVTDTAAHLEIAPGTVRSHLKAVRKRLKKVFPSWNY